MPTEISSVTYYLHESFSQPQHVELVGPTFETQLSSYGDFEITAQLSDGRIAKTWLSSALKLGHRSTSSKAIAKALAYIEAH